MTGCLRKKGPKKAARGLEAPAARFELASPFERQLSRVQGSVVAHRQAIDWPKFKEWLNGQYSKRYARYLYLNANRYQDAASDATKAAQLKTLSRDNRRTAMESLAALSKFTGTYETWQVVRKQSGLKWEQSDPITAVIAILGGEASDAIEWLKATAARLPSAYRTQLVMAALTGLRPAEAAKSCALIHELSAKGQLADYYDADLNLLQHFKYPKLFLRRTKNAYISFVTPRLIDAVVAAGRPVQFETIAKFIQQRLDMPNQSYDLRKHHATFMRQHLEREMIDMLQGRVGTSIFAKHYYRPLIAELRDKVLAATKPLEDELMPLLPLNIAAQKA